MIVVTIYRTDVADTKNPFDAFEILGIYDDVREDSVYEMVTAMSEQNPTLLFNISPGHQVVEPEETSLAR
jgi:hypothetical protein